DLPIDGISISHQISWRGVPRERLSHLPRHPLGGRMRRYSVVNELPAAVRKNYQTVEIVEERVRECRHGELAVAAIPAAWLRRKVAQLWPGRLGCLTMYLATVDSATSM